MFNNCQKLTSISFTKINLLNTANISYIFNGCISLTSMMINNKYPSSISDYSYMFNDCISLSYVNLSLFKTSNKINNKMGYMFNNCHNLTSIDFSYLDISLTIDYHNIFKSCNNIQYLNLSHLQANYISNLSYLFKNMSSLISIDLSNFKSPIIDHSLVGMFFNCDNLLSIDLSFYDFSKTTNITNIFRGCFSLISLDISGFKSSKIYDFSFLFSDCNNITKLSMLNFEGSTEENRMDYMFRNCKKLSSIELNNLDLSKTINISGMFEGCTSLENIGLINKKDTKIQDYSKMFNNCSSLTSINLVLFQGSKEYNIMDYMFNNCTNLQKVVFFAGLSGFDTIYTKSMKFMFNNCSSLTNSRLINVIINGVEDVSYMFNNCTSLINFELNDKMYVTFYKKSDLTNMAFMFNNCTNLETVDISNLEFDTNIILKGMFNNCISLKTIIFFALSIPKVMDFSYMFQNCVSLESLDFSVFKQIIVDNTLEGLFFNCNQLSILNISGFDTSKTTNMKLMFFNCSNLTSLKLDNFVTSSVTDMNSMFSNCRSLSYLNLNSFITNSVLDMSSMFKNCESISFLFLNNFNTALVKRMDSMFNNCYNLKSLYITNFNTKSVVSMTSMFENCNSLLLLNLAVFDTSLVTDMSHMFSNCISMGYLNISNFSENSLVKYDNIFDNTIENIVFCKDENKSHDSIILKILNEKLCSVNTCENNWSSKQRLINFNEKKCVENCLDNEILKYQFKSTCYEKCPNNSFQVMYQDYQCEIRCPEELPFYSNTYISCIDECSPYNFFNYECKINNKIIRIQEKMTAQIDKDILDDDKLFNLIKDIIFNSNETLLTQTENQIYQITSFEKGINLNTKIKFIGMESEFKKIYNLDNNSQLVIFLTEIQKDGLKIPIIEYNIYDLYSGIKFNLSNAINLEYELQVPIELDEKEEYIYNPYSEYYSNPCVKAISKDGYDIIINDRIEEFIKNNYSLCEKNCEYLGYNFDLKTISCKCGIKSVFKNLTEIFLDNDLLFSNLKRKKTISNFYVFRCIKLLSEKNGVLKNAGSYIILIIFLLFLVTLFLFIKYGYDDLEKMINELIMAKFYFLESKDRTKNRDPRFARKFANISVTFSKDLMLQKSLRTTTLFSLNLQGNPELKNILELVEQEKNWLPYEKAIEKDRRKFFEYYFSLIKRKNLFLFSFFPRKDYNLRNIKIYLFFFHFAIFFLVNTFFYNDSLIHQIYISHGKFDFKINLPSILCSVIVSYIIIKANKFLVLTELDIIHFKNIERKELLGKEYSKLLKKIFKKYVIFGVISICFFLFSWFYLSCFFVVYRNSQIFLFINLVISYILALLYPCAFCFIPSLLRFFALSDPAKEREIIYKISRIIQIF